MRKLLVCVVAMACVALCTTISHAQICGVFGDECLVNGNLDVGTAGGAGQPGTAPPWSLVNAGNATAAQFQGGFADNTGVRGIWYRAFLGGGQSMNPLVSADLSQQVVATMDGTYRLTFDRIVEQNFTAASMTATLSSSSGPSVSRNLLLDKVTEATYTGGGFVNQPITAPNYDISVLMDLPGVLAGDVLTVSLAMVNGQDGLANPQSVVADNFSLVKIPEPASAALSLIGVLGLVSLVRRR
jgi:hypothetical protein